MAVQTCNPATGQIEQSFTPLDDAAIETALSRAEGAALTTRSRPLDERAGWLENAAGILREDQDRLARLITTEMGKTLKAAKAEVEKCALVCDYYARHGPQFLSSRMIETAARYSGVYYLPLGPVLAVMPWNFPFWQVFRFAAPTLMAGNVGLLKHASNVPQCALAIEDIWHRAGVPDHAFQSLLIASDQVEAILKDDRVRAATLTGSEPAGRAVAETAGHHLKKVVLELGGSDPFIVMPSADLDLAVTMGITGRTMNNGQSCIAAKRFIVHHDIYTDFRDRFVAAMENLTIGDPMADDTDIGPLAMEQIRDELTGQIKDTLQIGGRRLTGAEPLEGPGWFFRPGVLEAVPEGSPADTQELFGPVATLYEADNFDTAIRLANKTRFGLGSALFTTEKSEMDRAFAEIDAGATFINTITASDPRLPFGGVKASGFGRELACEGIHEFVNIKTCAIGATTA